MKAKIIIIAGFVLAVVVILFIATRNAPTAGPDPSASGAATGPGAAPTPPPAQVTEISIFSAVMLVQSLPFLAAVAVTLFERSSLNDFATWRKLAAALATYRPRLPRGPQPTAGPPASGDIGILP